MRKSQPTLDGFIDFLGSRDPKEAYEYAPADTCAIGQYMKSIGLRYSDWMFDDQWGDRIALFFGWNRHITCPVPNTFGAARERAIVYRETLVPDIGSPSLQPSALEKSMALGREMQAAQFINGDFE